jgi:hypothetical protein
MRLKVLVNDTDFSDAALVEQTRIRKELSGRVSTAQVSFISGREAVYDEAQYGAATYGVDASELAEVELRDADTDDLLFAGQIASTTKQRWEESPEALQIDCTLTDWTPLLDVVIPSATFTGQTDRAIIQALIGSYAPRLTALTANIVSTGVIGYFEVKEKTLRDAFDELRDLTGCEYRVDFTRNFHWFLDGDFAAPFDLSTNRDEYRIDDYTRDAKALVNRCIVLGGLLPGGVEIRVQYDDPVSQQQYGVREATIIDREISLTAEALLRAQATVEANAYPLESGTAVTYKDGLDIGQSVELYHDELAVNGTYLIRSLEMSWGEDGETVEHRIEFGEPKPSIERLLRMLDARNRRATAIPTAVPAAGSVTDASVGSGGLSADVIGSVNASAILGTITADQIGSVNATNIIGSITAGQIGSVNATAILGSITSTQISSVNATTIQGAITAGQIGSVNATTIQGVIISSQVADGLINSLRQYSDALKPIARIASEPALPDPGWTENSVYYNTTTGLFRQVQSGAWATVTESTAITGKLEYWHVGTIKAGSIIGLIAAGQIDTITASQITGAISSSQIASVNASAIVGSITASQISTVNASSIQGSITSSQIASVAASTITGTITSSQIASVAASSITGTITSSQIGSVSASTITGTVTATQIGSVNAATITIGQVGNSQISSVSASKLTAGTIDASVITVINLSASNITSGTMSATRLTTGTITIGGTTIEMIASGVRVTTSGFQSLLGGTGITAPAVNAGVFTSTSAAVPGVSESININGIYYQGGFAGFTGTIPLSATSMTVRGGIITGYTP